MSSRHDVSLQFGQMGPCRRHKIEDVVAVCAGSSRHLPDFPKCVCRNILWYGSTYAQILSHPHALNAHFCHVLPGSLSCSPVCHVLWRVTTHTHTTPTRMRTLTIQLHNDTTAPSAHASYKGYGYGCNNAKPPWPPHRNTMIGAWYLGVVRFGRAREWRHH